MLLSTTENDLEENGVDGKGTPLRSIPDDVDMIKLEEEKGKIDYIVKEEAIEETMNQDVTAQTTPLRANTPLREKDGQNSISPNDNNTAFNTFEPKREAVEKDLLMQDVV